MRGCRQGFAKVEQMLQAILKSDLDFSATACPTGTFAAISGRGSGGYESRGRGGGRGRGDGLGFRGGRGGGRGGEVAVEVYSSVFFLSRFSQER